MTRFRTALIFIQVLLLFSFSSCGYVKRTEVKSATDEAHQKLRSGDFQKALDTYQSVYQKCPKDPEMLESYVKTIEYIKAHGDEAFDRENFVQAQITYDLLLKNFPRFKDFANLLSFKKNFLVTRLKMSRMFPAEKQARSCLKSGDIQKGIDIYRGLIQQYPWDTMVRYFYVSLLESIKGQGDLDFERKDLAHAGRAYGILLKNYSTLGGLERFLSYNAELLDTRIEICRKILFEEGLEQYRSGNLGQAISVWRNILTFDPENLDAKKARDKAIRQVRNLEKIKSNDAE